jgi:hypothetical protein
MSLMHSNYVAEYQENTYQQRNPEDCDQEVTHHCLPDHSAILIAFLGLQTLLQKELLIRNTVDDIRFTRNELVYEKRSCTCRTD